MKKGARKVAAPADLKPLARQRWEALYPGLARMGPVDAELLRSYCQVWARWREAEDGIQTAGQLAKTPSGRVVPSPLITVAERAAAQVRALEIRLRLSPAPAAPVPASSAEPSGGPGLTRPQLAKAMNVTPGTITRWERDGMPVATRASRGRHSTFDLAAVQAWRSATTTGATTDTVSLSRSRAKESQKRTEKLEIEIGVKRGELVHRDQVLREGHAFGRAIQARIRSLARRAEHAGIIQAAQVAGLEALCREVLDEISQWKTFGDLKVPTSKSA